MAKLNKLRELIGKPIYLSSACRCPTHNVRVGGKPLSQHRSTEFRPSTAFDITLKGAGKSEVIAAAIEAGFGGIGVNYRSFVHADDRGRKARW